MSSTTAPVETKFAVKVVISESLLEMLAVFASTEVLRVPVAVCSAVMSPSLLVINPETVFISVVKV